MTRGLGNNPDGSFTFLDILSVLSFMIGLANYEENMTQSDKQKKSKTAPNSPALDREYAKT